MAEFKLVISDPKTGKSLQKELKDDAAKAMVGKKIGDTFKGETIDMPGYEFQITGGSDSSGFPMRWDVEGQNRKKITTVKGVGVHNKRHRPNPKKKGMRTMAGMRLKKTVAGNTVYAKTAQINLKVTKAGKDPLFEEAKPAEGDAPKEAAPENNDNAPKEEVKKMDEEPKKEEAPAEAGDESIPESPGDIADKVGEKPHEMEKEEEAPKEEEKAEEAPAEEAPKEEEKAEEAPAKEAPKEEEKAEEAPAKEAPKEEEKAEEAPAEEKSDADETLEEVEKIDEEIKKDDEEISKENEEIDKIEKELEEEEKKE